MAPDGSSAAKKGRKFFSLSRSFLQQASLDILKITLINSCIAVLMEHRRRRKWLNPCSKIETEKLSGEG
jgi:hypothetical protein